MHHEAIRAAPEVAYIIGQATKSAVGYLRPDFLARCKPANGQNYQFSPQYGTITDVQCTETDIVLVDDGRSSFPSGAASCHSLLLDECTHSKSLQTHRQVKDAMFQPTRGVRKKRQGCPFSQYLVLY